MTAAVIVLYEDSSIPVSLVAQVVSAAASASTVGTSGDALEHSSSMPAFPYTLYAASQPNCL